MFERGVVTAIYNAFDRLWDSEQVLEIDEEEKANSAWSYEFSILLAKEGIELTVFAWGVGAGWTASSAVKATLIEIYDGTFDPVDETDEDLNGDILWSSWVAFFFVLIVSTFILWGLSGIQERRKKERQEELEKVAEASKDDDAKDDDDIDVVNKDDIEMKANDNDDDNDNDNMQGAQLLAVSSDSQNSPGEGEGKRNEKKKNEVEEEPHHD